MYRSPIKHILITSKKPSHDYPKIPSLIKTQLTPQSIALQYNSNNPVEDTYTLKHITLPSQLQSQSIQGIFMAVFDGHGGNRLSIFANNNIYSYFISVYSSLPECTSESERIVTALSQSIAQIEAEFLKESLILYQKGEGKLATVGSCALIALVINQRLYVANIGDSKAKLLSFTKDNEDEYTVTNISTTFNARKLFEQTRLIKEFPNDPKIFLCKRKDVCYVKGRLQPTRSLGDFHLKYKEFNEHVMTKENSTHYKKEINESFEKPFISSTPEIKVYELTDKDKWVILASDGLWDFLKSKEIAEEIRHSRINGDNIEKISEGLMGKVIEKAAFERRISFEELLKVPAGKYRRDIHDDITMILLSLDNNTKH